MFERRDCRSHAAKRTTVESLGAGSPCVPEVGGDRAINGELRAP
jgi:hypothetical protein